MTQIDAARLPGCPRTARHTLNRYRADGLAGLLDERLAQVSHRRPVDEVIRRVNRYQKRRRGWHVQHDYAWYKREGGLRSTTWVKHTL